MCFIFLFINFVVYTFSLSLSLSQYQTKHEGRVQYPTRDNPLRCSQMDCQQRCWQEGGPWRTERENNGCADSCHCSWFQFIHWQRWCATITLCVQWSQKCNNGRAMHWNRRQSSCGRTPSFHCIWLPPRIHPPQHISYGSHHLSSIHPCTSISLFLQLLTYWTTGKLTFADWCPIYAVRGVGRSPFLRIWQYCKPFSF